MLADTHLRSGHVRTAQALFERVARSEPAEPLRTWALLGGAWMAVRYRDVDRAVGLLGDAQSGGYFEPATVLLLALLEVSRGDPTGARRLQSYSPIRAPRAKYAARRASRSVSRTTGRATRTGRRSKSQIVSESDDAGVLEDEARYAVARMMLAEQRTSEARALLEEMVGAPGADAPIAKFPPGMLDLERRALLRKGFTGYRRTPIEVPAAQVVRLLDWNGTALARALLARLERQDRDASASEVDMLPVRATGGDGAVAARSEVIHEFGASTPAVERVDTRPGSASPIAGAPDSRNLALLGLAAVVFATCLVGFLRRGARRPTG